MAKKTKTALLVRVIFQSLATAILLFPAAWIIMVLFGAVADNYGLHTYGYMTVYFTLPLIDEVATVVFGTISRSLINGVLAIRDGNL